MSERRCIPLAEALRRTDGYALGIAEQRSWQSAGKVERGDYLVVEGARGYDVGYRVSRVEPSKSGHSVVIVFLGGARVRFWASTLVRVKPGVAM